MAEVSVHDDDKGAGAELQAVDVGGAEAEFAGAGLEQDAWGLGGGGEGVVGAHELLGDDLGAVGGGVVDDDYFPV